MLCLLETCHSFQAHRRYWGLSSLLGSFSAPGCVFGWFCCSDLFGCLGDTQIGDKDLPVITDLNQPPSYFSAIGRAGLSEILELRPVQSSGPGILKGF